MEPHIQYARTKDGVSIACYAVGSGPVLVWANLPFSHLQAERRDPETRRTYDTAASLATWVRYDPRGFGLSDRAVTSFTLDELASDLEAVVERLRIDRFVLIAGGASSPMALRYVASNAGHVTHLVLLPGFTRADGIGWKQWEALASMAVEDWDYVSEAMIRAAFGWESEESSRRDAELLRSAVTPETLVKYMEYVRAWDASMYVPNVSVPTLLLQQPEARYTSVDAARRLVSELPDGRLVMMEGVTMADRRTEMFNAVSDFVGADPPVEVTATNPDHAGTAIILFTDIADSTALTERMGDTGFRAASRRIDEDVRMAIRDAGGTPVSGKVLGDGVMGVFTSATQAIQAARRCVELSVDLPLHIGLHAGDVINEGDNVYGGAVNIASRICSLCQPGEILVSQTVRDLARTSAGVKFEDRGEQMLKGIDDAVLVFAVKPKA